MINSKETLEKLDLESTTFTQQLPWRCVLLRKPKSSYRSSYNVFFVKFPKKKFLLRIRFFAVLLSDVRLKNLILKLWLNCCVHVKNVVLYVVFVYFVAVVAVVVAHLSFEFSLVFSLDFFWCNYIYKCKMCFANPKAHTRFLTMYFLVKFPKKKFFYELDSLLFCCLMFG